MKNIQLIKANKTISSRRGVLQDVIRVAAYCRVSTDSEDQINSYNSQLVKNQNGVSLGYLRMKRLLVLRLISVMVLEK